MMALLNRTSPLTAAQLAYVRETVTILTSGEGDDRPTLDFGRLSDREAEDLSNLCGRSREGEGIDRTALGPRFWEVVALAAGRPGDFYETRRAQAVAAAKTLDREAKERRLP